jgi:hypothetical protein
VVHQLGQVAEAVGVGLGGRDHALGPLVAGRRQPDRLGSHVTALPDDGRRNDLFF